MVKLGVFLMARLWPVLAGTDAWMWTVGIAGLITLVLGAYLAIFQHDLKGLLAYSTVSHLGLITVLLGLNTPLGAVAAVFHILNHATFKASLFMAAGIIEHETGTRDIRRLNGLYRFMPITGTLAMVAAGAMAGVPLLNGFLSKEMFFAESLEVEGPVRALDRALPFIATLWGMFSVAYSVRFIHGVFFGPAPHGLPRKPHEPPRWMRFPIELLVLACLAVGVVPALTVGPLLDVAVRALLGGATPQYSLAVWHGFTTPFLMSLLALAGGVGLYVILQKYLARGEERTPLLPSIDARAIFDRVLLVVSWRWARWVERLFGTQRLQPQLCWLVLAALVAGLWPVLRRGLEFGPLPVVAGGSGARAGRGAGRGLRAGSRLAGEVPPLRGARARRRRRAGGLPDVRARRGARPRAHPADGRDRHHGAAAARTALAAQAHSVRVDPRRRARRTAAPAARSGARGELRRGRRRPRVCGHDPPAARDHLALLHGERLAPRRRQQRGEHHHRRLPRLRYAGRGVGARRGRHLGVRAAAALPPGARESRHAARAGGGAGRGRGPAGAGRDHALHVPGDRHAGRLSCCCAATTCRAAASSPAWRWRSP
jgi:hypothetical protein